jgi:hypothetical protein
MREQTLLRRMHVSTPCMSMHESCISGEDVSFVPELGEEILDN